MNDKQKTYLSKIRAQSGRKGGKYPKSVYSRSVKECGKLINLLFPIEIKRKVITKYGNFSKTIHSTMTPELDSLENFEKGFPIEYSALLRSTDWKSLKKVPTRFFEDFLFRIEKLVGKSNRARFIAAYCLILLKK